MRSGAWRSARRVVSRVGTRAPSVKPNGVEAAGIEPNSVEATRVKSTGIETGRLRDRGSDGNECKRGDDEELEHCVCDSRRRLALGGGTRGFYRPHLKGACVIYGSSGGIEFWVGIAEPLARNLLAAGTVIL